MTTETMYVDAETGDHVSRTELAKRKAKRSGDYCAAQARRTPTNPTHNGVRCTACGHIDRTTGAAAAFPDWDW